MKAVALVTLTLSTLLAWPVIAQRGPDGASDDPIFGTWQLNVSKSTYRPGPPPRSQVRTYEPHKFGVRATVKTVYADGRSTTVQTIYDYDKQEHPVTGSEETDSIVVTRMGRYLHEAAFSHAGVHVGTFRREISKDGRQMTVTLQRRAPPTDNVEVYEKVDVAKDEPT